MLLQINPNSRENEPHFRYGYLFTIHINKRITIHQILTVKLLSQFIKDSVYLHRRFQILYCFLMIVFTRQIFRQLYQGFDQEMLFFVLQGLFYSIKVGNTKTIKWLFSLVYDSNFEQIQSYNLIIVYYTTSEHYYLC